ncbi:hypothetical protein C8J56DRAFT_908495, partial [Mycena floridula]
EYRFSSIFIYFGFENVTTSFLNFSYFLRFFMLFALVTLVEAYSDLRFLGKRTCPLALVRFLRFFRILAYFSVSYYLYK